MARQMPHYIIAKLYRMNAYVTKAQELASEVEDWIDACVLDGTNMISYELFDAATESHAAEVNIDEIIAKVNEEAARKAGEAK